VPARVQPVTLTPEETRTLVTQVLQNPQLSAQAVITPQRPITFAQGSAEIAAPRSDLAAMARQIRPILRANPAEVIVILAAGDGGAADDSLSAERARALAEALAELFDIPLENLMAMGSQGVEAVSMLRLSLMEV
jgi:outer membrane protein OmpA-like peptidoglycan-associated protein